jgi:hypothetical protein
MQDGSRRRGVLKKLFLSVNHWGLQMDKRIYICIVVFLILALTALLAYNRLEIYPRNRFSPPSREVINNRYYALDQWLNETGHTVRIERESNPSKIANIPENIAVVFASTSSWEDAEEFLLPWIKNGNSLVICLEYTDKDYMDINLLEFLSGFGIVTEIPSTYSQYYWDENIPNFDRTIYFIIDEETDKLTIDDYQGNISLAEVSLGEGKLTVTGNPVFMQNNYLDREINARLAWELTGARAAGDDAGILFVRTARGAGTPARNSLFGTIVERGNLAPLIISSLLVIFFGFWMVIPVFGLVFGEKQKNSRPIRERFTAEIGFLRKHESLNYYLETYERELKLPQSSEEEQKYNYREIINKLRSINDGTNKFKRGISRSTT